MPVSTLKVFVLTLFFLPLSFSLFGQGVTRVKGQVFDANTQEPVSFATVSFKGTNVGVSTDLDGSYVIETRFPSDTLLVSFIGYVEQTVYIEKESKNEIDFHLESESLSIETVTVTSKKKKYKKKNNPSLELAKKVIASKGRNHLQSFDYYSYDQYEMIRLDLNNITEKIKNKRLLKGFDFVWDYLKISAINGKTYLPLFLREVISQISFEKSSGKKRELRKAIKTTDWYDGFDINSINDVMDMLYKEIDIYEDEIPLLEAQFLSPIASTGASFYRYYIIDTVMVNNRSAINLAFIPAVKGNMGFTGNLFISNDDRYSVLKVDMGIINGINLNFAQDLRLQQEFMPYQDYYVKKKDELVIDFALTKNSFGGYGNRIVNYDNYSFEKPEDISIFKGVENIKTLEVAYDYPQEFWDLHPMVPQNELNDDLYKMLEEVKRTAEFKTMVTLMRLSVSGYIPIGPFDFGPVSSIFSFNDVEGLNLRLGGETNYKFSEKVRLKAYGAYAFKTNIFKYNASITYAFNEGYKTNPRHWLSFMAERESSFPGQELEFFDADNILLSFSQGLTNKMLLTDWYELKYQKENQNFGYKLSLAHKIRKPYGSLNFPYLNDSDVISFKEKIKTTDIVLNLRYAPNEQFIQGQGERTRLYNEHPITSLIYTQGLKNILGGEYKYSRVQLNVLKQIEWTRLGTTDMAFNAGKSWGDLPYILQLIPPANQSYAHQFNSYNLMSFLEFVTDQYVSFNVDHFFYGVVMNRLPLIKKLKLREVVSFKIFYGSLKDTNNPNLDKKLIQFPVDNLGNPSTFTFGMEPYLEAGVGLTNIFRILRVDLVKRFTYLDQPNIPSLFGVEGMALRFGALVEF